MKISYIIGIGIALAFAIAISLTQSYTDTSDEKIRVAFFPSIAHAVPIVGLENEIFHENLSDETNVEIKIFDSGPQVIESLFSNSIDIAYVGPGPVINGYLKSDGSALKILKIRGNAMQSAVPKGEGGMLAVLGSDLQNIEKIFPALEILEKLNKTVFGLKKVLNIQNTIYLQQQEDLPILIMV